MGWMESVAWLPSMGMQKWKWKLTFPDVMHEQHVDTAQCRITYGHLHHNGSAHTRFQAFDCPFVFAASALFSAALPPVEARDKQCASRLSRPQKWANVCAESRTIVVGQEWRMFVISKWPCAHYSALNPLFTLLAPYRWTQLGLMVLLKHEHSFGAQNQFYHWIFFALSPQRPGNYFSDKKTTCSAQTVYLYGWT